MTDISDIMSEIMSDIADKTNVEKEKIRKEQEEKARKAAELMRKEEERVRKEAEEKAEQERVKKEREKFYSGKCSLYPEVYERYLKAGYKPTPNSMHPISSDRDLLAYYRVCNEVIDSRDMIEKIASYYKGESYYKVEHPCLAKIVKLASDYGMPKEDFNNLLGYATSPDVLDALVDAGADIQQFPMKEMMHYYGLSTGEVSDMRVTNFHDDIEFFPSPNYAVARNIKKTIKKVLEYGFDTNKVAKILSDGSYDAKLLQGCLNEIEQDVMREKRERELREIREREEKAFREEQAKLSDEGKEKGMLSFEDRIKKLEDSSMSMYDKGDEEIVIPFSTMRKDGGIAVENNPKTRERIQAYLKEHKMALKTSLHINQFARKMQKEGIKVDVYSQEYLKVRYGESFGNMKPGKLEVKVPQDKIQKFIKLNEGDIYQISSERPTLAKAPKGGVVLTKDGCFDKVPENMVVKEKTSSKVLQTERDM